MSQWDDILQLHQEAPLTDVHLHPSLKAYLFRRNLWRHYSSGKAFNPFSSRSDFKMLEKGRVGVIWNAHYLPERELFKQCFIVGLAASSAVPVYRKIMTGDRIDRVQEMMDALEREILREPGKVELAQSAADVRRIRQSGKMAVVHAIEGAHVLEGDLNNIDRLANRHVAMMILSHFFDNGVAAHTLGIPRNNILNKLCGYDYAWHHDVPLTDFGKDVLRRMTSRKMIADITHCTPDARRAIYGEVPSERPLIATHVGVQQLNPDPYNLADDEIREIAQRGGLIGVIFFTYWLDPKEPHEGLESIWRTIEHLHSVIGSFDHIALGSDFDGFTDPPDDVKDSSKLWRVTKMLLDKGLSDDDVKKILGRNAQTVLENGWV
jgi:membrane dipeptidase